MNQERVAKGIVDVQASAYEFFGLDSWPENEEFSKRMEEWMADQIRKCSWADMIDEKAIEMAERMGASSAAKAAGRFLN